MFDAPLHFKRSKHKFIPFDLAIVFDSIMISYPIASDKEKQNTGEGHTDVSKLLTLLPSYSITIRGHMATARVFNFKRANMIYGYFLF